MRYYFVILCGAVTLEARTSNKMWNIAAVIPVDKRIGSGGGGGGSNDSSSDDYDRITKVIIVSESKIETDQEQENEVRTKEERCAETPTPPLTLDVLANADFLFNQL